MTHSSAIGTIECHPPAQGTKAKWAAVVGDSLIPLPRRHLKARDILEQAGISDGTLVRDYNEPIDVTISHDDDVDLGEGNVFRIAGEFDDTSCEIPPGASAKFAFVADDAWEITLEPNQTVEGIRGLFEVPDDAEIFRDLESPDDELLTAGMQIRFDDGPVFRIQIKSITVKVNNKPVHFKKRRVTGLNVKQMAIAQDVAIEEDFVLYRIKPDGGLGPAIGDDEHLALKQCDEFRCVAPDDNS